jgi:uncharacterized membrane protein YdcZ (DUF606 family)
MRMARPSPVVTALAGASCTAASAVLVRLSGSSPTAAALFRCAFALPVLGVIVLIDRRRPRRVDMSRRAAWMARCSGLLLAVDLVVWSYSIASVGAGLATILGNLQVVVVAAVAWVLLHERGPRRRRGRLRHVWGSPRTRCDFRCRRLDRLCRLHSRAAPGDVAIRRNRPGRRGWRGSAPLRGDSGGHIRSGGAGRYHQRFPHRWRLDIPGLARRSRPQLTGRWVAPDLRIPPASSRCHDQHAPAHPAGRRHRSRRAHPWRESFW